MTVVQQNMRLGVCGVCESNRARYKCPKCKFASCSLKCVQVHKLENGCDGIRNKTIYIPKDRIAELEVLSDYRLLESTARCVDSYSRDVIKKSTRRFRDPHNVPLPPHLMKFKSACYRRGKCRLHFLPQKFERHRQNTSRFIWKKGEIFWKVQLQFPHATSPSSSMVVIDNISENTLVYTLMQPYIEALNPNHESEVAITNENILNERKSHGSYDIYKAAGFAGVKVLLKSEGNSYKTKQYYEMDISKSLANNLYNKNIVEHPVLLIILNHHSDSFNLQESSDDDDENSHGLKRNEIKLEETRQNSSHEEASCEVYPPGEEPFNFKSAIPDCQDSFVTINGVNKGLPSTIVQNTFPDPEKNEKNQSTNLTPDLSQRNTEKLINPQVPVLQQTATRKEAEFNKNCYDFYLNYYNEKYGVTANHSQAIAVNTPHAIPPTQTNNVTVSMSFGNSSISKVHKQTVQSSSAQSLVARQLLKKPVNVQAVTAVLEGSPSVINANDKKIEESRATTKNNSSLQLLSLYSDSEEEEMDT